MSSALMSSILKRIATGPELGSAFRPTAKTYLGGSAQNLQVSEIETTEDGAIRVRFRQTQSGEAAAAKRDGAAFVLEDGELIEAPAS